MAYSRRRFRRWRTSTGLYGGDCRQAPDWQSTRSATDDFARIGWVGIGPNNCGSCAISTAETVRAAWRRVDRQITGAVLSSKNYGEWSCWTDRGRQLRIT